MRRARRKAAARHLRALAALALLVETGKYGDVRRLVDGIDPIEARHLADELDPRSGAGRGTGGCGTPLPLLPAPVSSVRKPW